MSGCELTASGDGSGGDSSGGSDRSSISEVGELVAGFGMDASDSLPDDNILSLKYKTIVLSKLRELKKIEGILNKYDKVNCSALFPTFSTDAGSPTALGEGCTAYCSGTEVHLNCSNDEETVSCNDSTYNMSDMTVESIMDYADITIGSGGASGNLEMSVTSAMTVTGEDFVTATDVSCSINMTVDISDPDSSNEGEDCGGLNLTCTIGGTDYSCAELMAGLDEDEECN